VRANGAGEGNFRGKTTAVTHASASPCGRNPFGEVSHGIPGIRSPAAHAELSLPVPNADYRCPDSSHLTDNVIVSRLILIRAIHIDEYITT